MSSDEARAIKWSVVSFTETNEINLLPNNWISYKNGSSYCMWPEGDKSVSKKIKKAIAPEDSWPVFQIKILGEFETYEEGKTAERKLENESTDQEMEKNLGRGHRKIKRKLDSSFVSLGSMSPPPKIIHQNPLENDESGHKTINDARPPENSSEVQLQNSSFSEYVVSENGVLLECNQNSIDKINASSSVSNLPTTFSTETIISSSASSATSHKKSESSLLLVMYGILVEVKEIIGEIKEHLISSKNTTASTVTNFDTIPKKPFGKFSKLLKYNDILENNEDSRNQLETIFYLVGGSSIKEIIRRGLKRIFSNKLASKCSWTGRKGNYPLQNLLILRLLKVAARKRFNELTDQFFEDNVKIWFRQAQLRYSREQAHLQ